MAIFDIQDEKAEKLVAELVRNVTFVHVDVTSEASVVAGIEKPWIYSVRSMWPSTARVPELPHKGVDQKWAPSPGCVQPGDTAHLIGTFNVIRLAVEQMAKNTGDEKGSLSIPLWPPLTVKSASILQCVESGCMRHDFPIARNVRHMASG
ncbi:MAG: hypothetical protein R2875_14280 [Desulfobacterales bacterium]